MWRTAGADKIPSLSFSSGSSLGPREAASSPLAVMTTRSAVAAAASIFASVVEEEEDYGSCFFSVCILECSCWK